MLFFLVSSAKDTIFNLFNSENNLLPVMELVPDEDFFRRYRKKIHKFWITRPLIPDESETA
jgi:hypothetical protein